MKNKVELILISFCFVNSFSVYRIKEKISWNNKEMNWVKKFTEDNLVKFIWECGLWSSVFLDFYLKWLIKLISNLLGKWKFIHMEENRHILAKLKPWRFSFFREKSTHVLHDTSYISWILLKITQDELYWTCTYIHKRTIGNRTCIQILLYIHPFFNSK